MQLQSIWPSTGAPHLPSPLSFLTAPQAALPIGSCSFIKSRAQTIFPRYRSVLLTDSLRVNTIMWATLPCLEYGILATHQRDIELSGWTIKITHRKFQEKGKKQEMYLINEYSPHGNSSLDCFHFLQPCTGSLIGLRGLRKEVVKLQGFLCTPGRRITAQRTDPLGDAPKRLLKVQLSDESDQKPHFLDCEVTEQQKSKGHTACYYKGFTTFLIILDSGCWCITCGPLLSSLKAKNVKTNRIFIVQLIGDEIYVNKQGPKQCLLCVMLCSDILLGVNFIFVHKISLQLLNAV